MPLTRGSVVVAPRHVPPGGGRANRSLRRAIACCRERPDMADAGVADHARMPVPVRIAESVTISTSRHRMRPSTSRPCSSSVSAGPPHLLLQDTEMARNDAKCIALRPVEQPARPVATGCMIGSLTDHPVKSWRSAEGCSRGVQHPRPRAERGTASSFAPAGSSDAMTTPS